MADFNWTCPYCQRAQTVVDAKLDTAESFVKIADLSSGSCSLTATFIGCANPSCLRLTAQVAIRPANHNDYVGWKPDYEALPIITLDLLPEHSAKPQPDFIPGPIVEDYIQASRIKGLSPKAAATLARRCLQGMIRDFAKISKKRLIDEIVALRAALDDGSAPREVTPESVDAIDAVRKVGNIGAHMEADIDHIIEVDEGEANVLLELIEMLFDEWYVAQRKRQDRLARVSKIANEKEFLKSGN